MRKAIVIKFVQVLLAALALNSVIFYVAASSMMLRTVRKDMLYTLESIDSILDYEDDLETRVKEMEEIAGLNQSRLTFIAEDGTVLADTGAEEEDMDNHLKREEVAQALREGQGYSTRYSDTLKENMLYVAYRSPESGIVLRIAVPFSGMQEYLPMLLPAAWLLRFWNVWTKRRQNIRLQFDTAAQMGKEEKDEIRKRRAFFEKYGLRI